MPKSWWYKIGFYAFVFLFSVFTLLPTFLDWESDEKGEASGFLSKILPKDKIKLGLDLRGGIHLVLGVDTDRILENESRRYVEDLRTVLAERKIKARSVNKIPYSSQLEVVLESERDQHKLKTFLTNRFSVLEVVKQNDADATYTLDLVENRKKELKKYTLSQSIETIRNRIDEYGVSEPDVRRQGSDRILVQLPGETDPERAKAMISKTAQLEFKLVSNALSSVKVKELIDQTVAEKGFGENYSVRDLNDAIRSKLPADTEILFEIKRDDTSGVKVRTPWLLEATTLMTGEQINDARMNFDSQQFNQPIVNLTFNQRGADEFRKITTANVKRLLAIVLDNVVNSAPVIKTAIPNGRAQIEMGGGADIEQEARDLAAVLRAGALPAPVEILENRTVGPTLGEDSIEQGKISMTLAALLVVLFILFYYRVSGAIATLAVFLNLLCIMAFLAFFEATLTLPGIAGMTLIIGMAVDANVIIFERIREELRAKKSAREAVHTGFERAHLTILDANLTTLIAGVVLLQYGSGPIKGFAVTLIIGLIANYFTAVWLSRLIFDYLVEGARVEKLSI